MPMELPAGLTPPPSDLVASLRAALAPDRVAIPGDPNYAAFHKSDNRDLAETFPCAIARCLSAEEVAAALLACRRHNLPISIAAGRHSAKFFRHNAVCIDLRLISYVKVDPETRIARVGAGTKNGELDAACEKFGMFVTAGTNTDTGVAGLTLGGGYGYLARQLGMTIDSLLSATIVTADGRIIRDCSESNEPDLLFAIRGAGANFGCVTEFVFKLHPITTTVYGGILYPAEEKDMARNLEVCRGYKAHMDTAPNEVSSVLSFAYSPPPKIKPMLSVIPIYNGNGTKEEAFELLRPIREMESRGFNVGPHMLSVLHRRKYSQLQSSLDAGSPAGTCWYGKNVFVDRLDDAIFEHLLKTFREIPVSTCSIAVLPTGGKVGERKVHETAYPHRTSKYWIFVWCVYTEPSLKPAIRTWGNKVIAGCAHAKVGAFANQYEQASEGYEVWGANRERLLELKRKWDPDNVFSATISLGGSGEKAAL